MTRSTFIAAGLALAAVLPAIPSQAAGSLTRTFVSSAGHDSNPCTITQPCATFAVAYAATAANGIIAALDPGKYGPVTITGPEIDGAHAAYNGIQLDSGGSLTVTDCVIRNFLRYGFLFQPNNSSKISVSNTAVSDNNYGIYIGPTGSATTNGVLGHVHIENNINDGITVITDNQLLSITVNESVSANNGGAGINHC